MNHDPYKRTRWLIWLYFFLLVFEGVPRKWIIPSLSNPLLIIRDPVVILIYLSALLDRSLELKNLWVIVISVLGITTFACGFLAERAHLSAMMYGFRTNFLHIPLIFVMAKALNLKDIVWLGKFALWVSIPMAFLMAAQFRGGAGHWLNAGAGKGAGQLLSAMGKVRASGTFSFITGPVLFYPMVTAYLLYGQVKNRAFPLLLIGACTMTLILASASSGSRSLLATCMITGLFFFVGLACHPPSMAKAFKVVIFGALAYLVVSLFDIFQEATEVFAKRIELATTGSYKGLEGYIRRISQMFYMPLTTTPLFGRGLGIGTNAGAALIGMRGQFLLAENEWHRIVAESGPVLGVAFIGYRVAFTLWALMLSIKAARGGNLMPILMLGATAPTLFNGQFGPPTALGFGVFVAGCCLASLNDSTTKDEAVTANEVRPRRRAYEHRPGEISTTSALVPRPGGPRKAIPQPGRWTVRPGSTTPVAPRDG